MQPQTPNLKRRINLPKIKLPRLSSMQIKAVLAVLVLAIGGYFGYRWYANRTPAPSAFTFTYNKTEAVKLPGQQAGSGMSLVRPTDLTLAPIEAKATQASMYHVLLKNNQPVTVAQIAVASVYAGIELSSDYLKNLNTAMTDVKSANHAGVIKPVKEFVTNRAQTGYNITFSDPKTFTSDTIKSNAWYMTFTGTAKDAKAVPTLPPLSGEVVLSTGKSTFYYFMVDSITVNWQPNQKVWDQVINSLKIDQ